MNLINRFRWKGLFLKSGIIWIWLCLITIIAIQFFQIDKNNPSALDFSIFKINFILAMVIMNYSLMSCDSFLARKIRLKYKFISVFLCIFIGIITYISY